MLNFGPVRASLIAGTLQHLASMNLWYGDLKTAFRYLHMELSMLVFLPIFTAAMARGHG